MNKDKTYFEIFGGLKKNDLNKTVFLVKENGFIKELRHTPNDGVNYTPMYYDDTAVKRAYANTAIYIALKVAYEMTGSQIDARFKFRIRNGYYFEFENIICTDEFVQKIKDAFQKVVDSRFIIEKKRYTRDEAFKIFDEKNMQDVKLLFKYSMTPHINLRNIDNYLKYVCGELLYDTGYIVTFNIERYKKGFVLILPSTDDVSKLEPFIPGEKYFEVQNETIEWVRKLGIDTVGKLNAHIAKNDLDDIIIMTESYQDKLIGDIASKILESKKKFVFIAGPSSSGKTSFSHRLMYHLRALKLNPHPIASDNFFIDREKMKKDESGEIDLESINAMDIKLLNDTLNSLMEGKETDLPTFDFVQGKKYFKGNKLKLDSDDILIVEGIHCLNPALTPEINRAMIFGIYVSAFASISLDYMNRIATSDLRLIRRMERDRKNRGNSITDTIKNWGKVRRGEEKNIFPFQENADVYFNSSLSYELCILKTYILPNLFEATADNDVRSVIIRIMKILNFCIGIYTETIPKYSIIREFIGGSIMNIN